MPVNVVKPGQEKHWRRAKALAAEQGHEENYAIVMSIFKRLIKGEGAEELNKAVSFIADHSVAPIGRSGRWPGQVPKPHPGMKLVREMERKPGPVKVDLISNAPLLNARRVVQSLGLTHAQEDDWEAFVRKTVDGAKNEVEVRQAVNRRARDKELHPVQRSELTRKAGQFMRSRLQKSVTILSAAELIGSQGEPVTAIPVIFPDELRKGDPKGGKYHRRIPLPKGGYRYIYDPKKYQGRADAHVSGEEALKAAITKSVTEAVTGSGSKGLEVKALRALAKKHGRDHVVAHLTEAHKSGALKLKKGRLFAGKTTQKQGGDERKQDERKK